MSEGSAVAHTGQTKAAKDTWLDFLLTRGPVGVIALGGTGALFEGLFPIFDLKEAIFGSTLLLVAAMFDLLVWIVRRRDVVAELKILEEARVAAQAKKDDIDRGAPTTGGEVQRPEWPQVKAGRN